MKELLVAAQNEQRKRAKWPSKGGVEPKLSPEEEQRQTEMLKRLGYIDAKGDEGK